MTDKELQELLTGELGQRHSAPADLWARIVRAGEPKRRSYLWVSWAVPAAAMLVLGCLLVYQTATQRQTEAAVRDYVSAAPLVASAVSTVGGYPVTGERSAVIAGNAVKQIVLKSPDRDNAISIFISDSKLRLPPARTSSLRMVQFQCSKQMCLAACKRCSERAIQTLVASVAAQPIDFR